MQVAQPLLLGMCKYNILYIRQLHQKPVRNYTAVSNGVPTDVVNLLFDFNMGTPASTSVIALICSIGSGPSARVVYPLLLRANFVATAATSTTRNPVPANTAR